MPVSWSRTASDLSPLCHWGFSTYFPSILSPLYLINGSLLSRQSVSQIKVAPHHFSIVATHRQMSHFRPFCCSLPLIGPFHTSLLAPSFSQNPRPTGFLYSQRLHPLVEYLPIPNSHQSIYIKTRIDSWRRSKPCLWRLTAFHCVSTGVLVSLLGIEEPIPSPMNDAV
ncbi:hypothetical protein JB92DRAFT_2894769 [Gautieria morchelliformis]|nr:hypothetical protein JB92DRAFT_2894769 [Gautieria morchelliformis]